MTRKEFDNCVLLVEQKTGVTGSPEEIKQLWALWENATPRMAKFAFKMGLALWTIQEFRKELQQKHTAN